MSELILLDVFSYSCMNCLRSLGFIKKIDNRYRKFGLKTIIVHPPEWEFEKDSKNIIGTLKDYNINFPVIIDKNRKIIKKLKISFWPAQILTERGKILYKNVGEGNYKELEDRIVKFLKISSKRIFRLEPKCSKFSTVYCGKRKRGKIKKLNKNIKFGYIYVDGNWIQKQEYVKSLKNNSYLTILTKGKITNLVAESLGKKPIKISIKLNDKGIDAISVNKPQLHNIIKLKNNNKQNKLTITANKNLAIYSFSFQ